MFKFGSKFQSQPNNNQKSSKFQLSLFSRWMEGYIWLFFWYVFMHFMQSAGLTKMPSDKLPFFVVW